jgi:hypothetical protein
LDFLYWLWDYGKCGVILNVTGSGSHIKQVQAHRPMLDPAAQDVDDATFGDLPLEPVQELRPRGAVLVQCQRRGRFGEGTPTPLLILILRQR